MAKEGQVFKKYTQQERNKITLEYMNGETTTKILGEKYGIPYKTINTWVRKYRTIGTTDIQRKSGRPKSNLNEIEQLRLENEILKKFQAFLKVQQEKK
jgi:transposase-like protein